jgi:hypothetical protein
MDEEMNFPNPVVRTDLPVKKPAWPRLLIGTAAIVLLCLIFLPQVLSTRVGKRIMRARLEGRYNAEIVFQDFSTSWFGGTTVNQFWIKSSDGRLIGFNSLKSEVSLASLLRGKYRLGKCTVDGLYVDYVLDSGDDSHRDTYERLTGATPRLAGAPPAQLAVLSGNIHLTNAQLNLHRGRIDPLTLGATFQSVKFSNINGSFDITKLDAPWTYQLAGAVGVTGHERGQTFETHGTLNLGQNSQLLPARIAADVDFAGRNVPTDLVAVVLPLVTLEDLQASFGPLFDRFHFTVKGDGGALRMDLAEAASGSGQAHLQMMMNLGNGPATISMASKDPSDNMIAAALPGISAKRAMAIVNPLALSARRGAFVLRIESLNVPIASQWSLGQCKGELELHDVSVTPRGDPGDLVGARALVGQLSAISGETKPVLAIQPMPVAFTMNGGNVAVGPATLGVGSAQVQLSGSSTIEGKLRLTLGVMSPALAAAVPELAGKPLEIPLVGTFDSPRLDLDAGTQGLAADVSGKVRNWVTQQVAAQRTRESDDSQRDKDLKVQEMLKGIATDSEKKP